MQISDTLKVELEKTRRFTTVEMKILPYDDTKKRHCNFN